MNWAAVFVVFMVIFTMFSSSGQSPSYQVLKSAPSPLLSTMNVRDQYLPTGSEIPTYNSADLNAYQVIISYIMDNYKKVYLADVLSIAENIVNYCAEHNIDPLFITAVIAVESEFNKNAVSSSGAKGLGQLMPFNLRSYKVEDPFDIQQNVRASVLMIKGLLVMWKGDVSYALASYFEGENAIKRKKESGFSPKTTQYVYRILSVYDKIKQYL